MPRVCVASVVLEQQGRVCCACCVCQVGGGDQLYCDPVFELPSLKPWLAIDDPHVSLSGLHRHFQRCAECQCTQLAAQLVQYIHVAGSRRRLQFQALLNASLCPACGQWHVAKPGVIYAVVWH